MQLPDQINSNKHLAAILDFILPPLCLGCAEYTESDFAICEKCDEKIRYLSQPLCLGCEEFVSQPRADCDNCREKALILYALGEYSPPLSDIIIQFKFKGITTPAKRLASQLCDCFGERLESTRADFLVPIPLHISHERTRGYNQAALFARELAQLLAIPVNETLLARTRKRRPQAKLQLADRARNINSVYNAISDSEDRYDLLLVDDVVTSGATVKEAARTLTAAGHRVKGVVSIAHAS